MSNNRNLSVLAQGVSSSGALNASYGGSITWQSVQTASFTAVAGNAYPINTTSAAVTVTLPASPVVGQVVQIVDYAGTFATNNCTINPNGGKISGSASNVILYTNRQGVSIVYVDSTQGWLGYGNFINNPVAIPPYTISYLIAAGGGGGGANYGGGGGAGGLLSNSSYSVSGGDLITVTVGAGGAGGVSSTTGSSGNNSIIAGPATSTAYGGGGGGTDSSKSGLNGGSGGGTAINGGTAGVGVYPGSTYINAARQGYDGGAGDGAGGGGAGAVGSGTGGGTGAISTIITTAQATTYAVGQVVGSDVYFSGGGGGWGRSSLEPGGNGGGGNGAYTGSPTAGTAYTGGGGGGGTGGGNGGAGGSGVVILSIPTANYTGVKTGSPTVFTSGSSTILIFTASGSYTA